MLNKSIEQLENDFWGEPDPDDSMTVRQSFRLRKKPIGKLTIEDLRFLIGQQIGVDFILPLALQKLEHDILAEGDYYPGDLLTSVLDVNTSYWRSDTSLPQRLLQILNRGDSVIETAELSSEIKEELLQKIETFKRS